MLQKQLQQLGFTKNETKVYLALFELGRARAGEVIDETTLHRNIVYTALDQLVARGLVTKTVVGKVAEFVANAPESLIVEVEEKKLLAQQVAEQLKRKQHDEPREVIVYEGFEGVKKSRNKVYQYGVGDVLYVLGASSLSSTSEYEKYWRKFHEKRESLGIGLKILYENGIRRKDVDWRNALPLSEVKYLPIGLDSPVWFSAIGNNLEIGVPGDEPLVFNIRSKEAVDGVKKYFDYFWNQKVIVETGLNALQKMIYDMLDELDPGEEYFVLGASVGLTGEPGQLLYDRFHKDRINKGVITNMLAYEESYDLIKKRFAYSGDPEGKVSHLKKTISATPIPMQINMYKGKVFMVLYGAEPTVIHFDKPEVHDAFRAYFDELWKQDTTTLYGAEAVKQIWLESIETGALDFIGARGYFVDLHPEMYKEILEKIDNVSKKQCWRNVVDQGAANHKLNSLPWMEARYTMKGSKNPNVVWLWGEKVAVANWTDDEPVLLVSENKHLVQSYRDYFDELWGEE